MRGKNTMLNRNREHIQNELNKMLKDPNFDRFSEGILDHLVQTQAKMYSFAQQQKLETIGAPLDADIQPVVTILFSESGELETGEKMNISLADEIFSNLNDEYKATTEFPGSFNKTKFKIDYNLYGVKSSITSRYDIGTESGGLIEHINGHNPTILKLQKQNLIPAEKAHTLISASNNLVDFLNIHKGLNQAEIAAIRKLEITPEGTSQCAELNKELESVAQQRELLQTPLNKSNSIESKITNAQEKSNNQAAATLKKEVAKSKEISL